MDVAQIRLVVNADDFGMSPEISRGILRAHREGVVTSTSVLGNVADVDGVRALLAEAPGLGVGVHLTLIGGAPVAPAATVPSLVGSDGSCATRGQDFIAAWAQRKIDSGRRRARARGPGRRASSPQVSRSTTWTHIDTWGSSPPSAVRSKRSRAATTSPASGAPSRARRWPGRLAASWDGRGDAHRARLDDPPAARRAPPRAAELGLRRIGPPRRGSHPGDCRPPDAGPSRAHLSSGRPPVRRQRRRRGRLALQPPAARSPRSPLRRSAARSSGAGSTLCRWGDLV